jgi:hypothetical protein
MSRDKRLLPYLKTITSAEYLHVIKNEYESSKGKGTKRTSVTLFNSLIEAFPSVPKLSSKQTSWKALKYVLLHRMTSIHLGSPVTKRRIMNILVHVKKLIEVMFHDKALSQRQAMSDIRHHVVKLNFGIDMVHAIKADGRFALSSAYKATCKDQQSEAVKNRTINQRSIDYEQAINIGKDLVKRTRDFVCYRDRNNENDPISLMLATIMYTTGTRLTEAVILSDYEPIKVGGCGIELRVGSKAESVLVNPVAKTRDDSPVKTSKRVLLFGVFDEEIQLMVDVVRNLMTKKWGARYKLLKRNAREDRECAMRLVVAPLTVFVKEAFKDVSTSPLIPRDLRALYVSLSYHQFAKRSTSQCMWINQLLGHSSMDTSITYNSFYVHSDDMNHKRKIVDQNRKISSLSREVKRLKQSLNFYEGIYAKNSSSEGEDEYDDPWIEVTVSSGDESPRTKRKRRSSRKNVCREETEGSGYATPSKEQESGEISEELSETDEFSTPTNASTTSTTCTCS